ncbi:hypothetical protein LXL04_036469 [Taraxacum kok-saghyz]
MIKRGRKIAGAFRKLVPPYEPFPRFPVLQKPDPKPDLLLPSNLSRDREKDTREINRTLSIAAIGNRRLPSWTIGPSWRSIGPSPSLLDTNCRRTPTQTFADYRPQFAVDLPLASSTYCRCLSSTYRCSSTSRWDRPSPIPSLLRRRPSPITDCCHHDYRIGFRYV